MRFKIPDTDPLKRGQTITVKSMSFGANAGFDSWLLYVSRSVTLGYLLTSLSLHTHICGELVILCQRVVER